MTGGTSSLVKRISRMSRTKYLAGSPGTHSWLVAPMTLMMSSPFTRLATMAPRSSRKSSGKLCSIPSAPTNVTVLHFSGSLTTAAPSPPSEATRAATPSTASSARAARPSARSFSTAIPFSSFCPGDILQAWPARQPSARPSSCKWHERASAPWPPTPPARR